MTTRHSLAVLSATTLLGSMAWILATPTARVAPTTSSPAIHAERAPVNPATVAATRVPVSVRAFRPSVDGATDECMAPPDPAETLRSFRERTVAAFTTDTALARAAVLLSREDHDEAEIRELGDLFRTMTWAAADRPEVCRMLEMRILGTPLRREVADFGLCAIAQAATCDAQTALLRIARNADTASLRAASVRAMHHLDAPTASTLGHLASSASRAGVEGTTSMLVLGALTGRGDDEGDPGARLLAREPARDSADYELWLAAWGNTASPRAAEVAMRSYRSASSVDGCLAALEAVRQARGSLAEQLLREANRHPESEVRAAAAHILSTRNS